MYANDAGSLNYLDNPRYARYWPVPTGERYSVLEPLSRSERLSQIATSNRWRVWAGDFAAGAGRFAAALPLFGEAITDAYKVAKDIYKRPRSPNPKDYDLVMPTYKRPASMHAPGAERPGGARNMNQSGHVQYSRKRSRKGRKMSVQKMSNKLIRTSLINMIDRFIGINAYSGNQGYFKLWNYTNITPAAGSRTQVVPWHLFDITSRPYDGGAVNPAPFGLGCRLDDAGQITWQQFRGSDAAGLNYQVYSPFHELDDGGTMASGITGDKLLLSWVDIRMLLYGNSTNATRWTIDLLQFTFDEDQPGGLVPPQTIPPNTYANVGGSFFTKASNFIRPYVFSPIMPAVPNDRLPYVRKIKTWDFMQQPKATTVGDTDTPPVQEFRFFYRTNRICDYSWQPKTDNLKVSNATVPTAIITEDATVTGTNPTTPTVYNVVTPKARMFFSVRCSVLYETGATDVTPETAHGAAPKACSYDLCVRRKWLDQQ